MKIRIRQLFALSLGFAGLILVTQARAGIDCGPRDRVLARFVEPYHQTQRAIGPAGKDMVMETFVSDLTQSWSITVTTPQGDACLIASGLGLDTLALVLPPQGDPA